MIPKRKNSFRILHSVEVCPSAVTLASVTSLTSTWEIKYRWKCPGAHRPRDRRFQWPSSTKWVVPTVSNLLNLSGRSLPNRVVIVRITSWIFKWKEQRTEVTVERPWRVLRWREDSDFVPGERDRKKHEDKLEEQKTFILPSGAMFNSSLRWTSPTNSTSRGKLTKVIHNVHVYQSSNRTAIQSQGRWNF